MDSMKYIENKTKIINDEYTEYVFEAFDIQNKEETVVKIPMNFSECKTFEWNIGVIYGGSGTGKTTLLKEFGSLSSPEFSHEKPLISNFDWLTPKEATFLLSAMGLASVPTWLRPFHTLSNGEQYRAKLAHKVGKATTNAIILIDEYTSVVDRDVAKAMSNALQKYIRKTGKKIVLASCHFDIMEWLRPDWTYSPLKGRVEKSSLQRQSRPKIKLQIFRCRYETWKIFKQHHYLTEDYNKAAHSFCATWNGKMVAFIGVLELPGMPKKAKRFSRTVVLPDYQGLGIGSRLTDYFAELYTKENYSVYTRTVNPALGEYRKKSKKWESTGTGNHNNNNKYKNVLNRESYGFKFIGKASNDSTDIIKFNASSYKNVAQNQITLF